MTRPAPRSVLYVPASKPRAMAKAEDCGADAVIFDLEDAVSPQDKSSAREALRAHFAEVKPRSATPLRRGIRINALTCPWGTEDLLAARACRPDFIVVPKVGAPDDLHGVDLALQETDAPDTIRLWAMIETASGLVNAAAIARATPRLECLMAGLNDLMLETGMIMDEGSRRHLEPLLVQMMIAARAGGLFAIDGVCNDFSDEDRLVAECRQARVMGLDGKSLIHPAQVDAANAAFSPSDDEIATARAVIAAFAEPENVGKGVISIGGRMLELLHLHQARAVLHRAAPADDRE